MWALVSPSWWWVLAAWFQNKADFCVHVATSIEDAKRPQEPEEIPPGQPGYVPRAATTAAELDERYDLSKDGWQEGDPN